MEQDLNSLTIKGPDASDYLTRLTTFDSKKIPVGKLWYGFILNPKGTIDVPFLVCKKNDSEFELGYSEILDPGLGARIKERLEFFHFGENFEILDEQKKFSLAPPFESEAERIAKLIPWFGTELTSDNNPLELGLRPFIHEQKGCYPGQEVLEKILAFSEPAKRLCLVDEEGRLSLKKIRKTELKTSEHPTFKILKAAPFFLEDFT